VRHLTGPVRQGLRASPARRPPAPPAPGPRPAAPPPACPACAGAPPGRTAARLPRLRLAPDRPHRRPRPPL